MKSGSSTARSSSKPLGGKRKSREKLGIASPTTSTPPQLVSGRCLSRCLKATQIRVWNGKKSPRQTALRKGTIHTNKRKAPEDSKENADAEKPARKRIVCGKRHEPRCVIPPGWRREQKDKQKKAKEANRERAKAADKEKKSKA